MKLKKIIGTEQLGSVDWGNVDVKKNLLAINNAIKNYDWNYIDTAAIYDLGNVESLLGQNQDSIKNALIWSKLGMTWNRYDKQKRAKVSLACSMSSMLNQAEKSLTRLRKKKIHTYFLHYFDKKLTIKKQLKNIIEIKKRNYSNFCGVCNPNLHCIEDINNSDIDYVQIEMSILTNNIELIKKIKKKIILFSTLGRGLLTNNLKKINYPEYLPQNDRRARLIEFKKKNIKFIKQELSQVLKKKINFSESNLAFLKKYVRPNGIIVGFKNNSQLNDIKEFDKKNINRCNYSIFENAINNLGSISKRNIHD